MSSRNLLALLERAGYSVVRVRGSHHRLEHPTRPPLTLALHSRELPPGLVRKILMRDACLTDDEISDLR